MDPSNASPMVVLCTAPDPQTAAKLARGLVESRLAACANVIDSIQSFFWWEGKVEQEGETQLIVKTERKNLEALTRYVTEHHPYAVPEIIALPIEGGLPAYLSWLAEETQACELRQPQS